jgi:molecular chaperone HtpG
VAWSFRTGDKFEKEIKLDPPPPFCIHHNDTSICIFSSAVDDILCIYKWISDTKVVLWNPATNEVYVVPPNLPECLPNVRVHFLLHGFGYDHVSDDYKVIRFVYYTVFIVDSQDVHVTPDCFWEIYSLRNNSWRKLNVDMPSSYSTNKFCNVYMNGVCHWLQKGDDENYLVSFNLSNHVFFKTPFDKHVGFCFNLTVLNGSVALITSNYKWTATTSFSISILGEIGVKESWINLFEVRPLTFIGSLIPTGKKSNIFFRTKDDKLCCFDLTTGVIEEINDNKNKGIWDIVIYKKNLRPIKEINKELFYSQSLKLSP